MSVASKVEEKVHEVEDSVANVLHVGQTDIRLLLRHKIQIFGFWTIIILAIGGLFGLKYASHENKKFFEIATIQGSFYYVGKDGKGKVCDLTERPLQQSVSPVTPSPSTTATHK